MPWPIQRKLIDSLSRVTFLPRGTSVTWRDIGGVPAAVVLARGASEQATVAHFHGGGYCVGSPHTVMSWAAHLSAQVGCRVVLPRYRLAPEHPYPAAVEDARAVIRALAGEATLDLIVISGDSAGAGLALTTVLDMRENGQPLPAGCILMSPWLDLSRDWRADADLARRDILLTPDWLDACARAYAAPDTWASPAVSPLHATHAGLPPLLIQSGSDDLLVRDARLLAASASAAGVRVTCTEWPRMWHDFALEPGLVAAADDALAQAASFVTRVTACLGLG